MKKMLICLTALVLIAGFGVIRAEAADDTIVVTVTIENVSIEVTPSAWPIGTISAGDIATQDPCVALNNGNVTEDLTIAISNSSAWTAGAAAGADVFAMDFGAAGGPYNTNITTGGVSLTSGLASGASYNFGLEFNSPSPTTDYTQQTITVTVTAAAS
ncbi:MAG: hypothetical protein ABH952_08210 [Candidatus Omnitrophota bacterium]